MFLVRDGMNNILLVKVDLKGYLLEGSSKFEQRFSFFGLSYKMFP